jgi:HlyD family secretion protein
MKKKWIIAIVVVLGLTTVGYFVTSRGSNHKYEYRVDKVTMGDITMVVTATGTINAVTSVDVGTQVSGIVSRLYADFNSVVKAGQVIAQIDSTFLVQAVRDADANLDRAKAQLADSKRAFDREKILLEKGLEPQVNYDAAMTTYESNQAALKQAEATLDRAKINLQYATIYAPINGVVVNRAVNVGQTVAASFSSPTLYTIANDMSKMQVLATVDESDIGRISISQDASFTVDAYPDETFIGRISQIRLNPVSIQNVVNYTVVIDVNNDQLKLMPGMTANVKVVVASTHNVLRVPNMAIRFQPPADAIDSNRVRELKESFAKNGVSGGDPARRGAPAAGLRDTTGGGSGTQGANDLQKGRQRFQALRDSITAAHGGNISQDDLRGEMRKVMSGNRSTGTLPSAPVAQQPRQPKIGTQFGITRTFPEYEKAAFIPNHQAGRARLWLVNAKGMLEPVFVLTGVTDGKYTEVTAPDLKQGDEIVLGITSGSGVAAVQNPLTGGGQQRPPGGGGGFR